MNPATPPAADVPRPAPAVAPAPFDGGAGPLDSLVAIDVTGADAEAFLQGQFSNDLVALGPDAVQLTGWCSPKGRLLATVLVHRVPDGFRLVLPAELAPGFVQRLRMFVLRAAVTVAVRDDLAAVALFVPAGAGPDVGDALGAGLAGVGLGAAAGLLAGEPLRAVAGADDASALRWHDLTGAPAAFRRLLALVPRAALGAALRAALDGACAAGGAASPLPAADADALWRLGDVRAGLPAIRTATRDAFVPQMVNLGEAGGLSFRKGCYPGQEIVARMQYLGKLKRHMRAFRAAPAGPAGTPVPGDALDVRAPDGGTTAGGAEVVDAVAVGDALEVLAVVRVDAADARPVVGGVEAAAFDMPYELPPVAPRAS